MRASSNRRSEHSSPYLTERSIRSSTTPIRPKKDHGIWRGGNNWWARKQQKNPCQRRSVYVERKFSSSHHGWIDRWTYRRSCAAKQRLGGGRLRTLKCSVGESRGRHYLAPHLATLSYRIRRLQSRRHLDQT